jgi:hypothetical protein
MVDMLRFREQIGQFLLKVESLCTHYCTANFDKVAEMTGSPFRMRTYRQKLNRVSS